VNAIEEIFGKQKCLIGVVHLMPLPGSPRWGGDMGAVIEAAMSDVSVLESAGFDGAILENFGDAPFARSFAGRGAVAAMSAVGTRVAERGGFPVGINVLRSDALSAVAVSSVVGARFIRVNVHTGAAVTDQGIIQGNARQTMLAIRESAPGLAVFADVFVKHASPLGTIDIERAAMDTVERGHAAAVIVTGGATGEPTSLEDVARVKGAVPGAPVLVGSGVTVSTVVEAMGAADGVIVGSAVMEQGLPGRAIDYGRAASLVGAARA
jgi:membrane complex biogenesis BtpA family protein